MSEVKLTKSKGTLTLLVIGVFVGIILWGGFNTAMEETNSEKFYGKF